MPRPFAPSRKAARLPPWSRSALNRSRAASLPLFSIPLRANLPLALKSGYVRTFLLAAFLCLCGLPALGAHTQVGMVLDVASARLGDTVMAGIHLRMEPGWH